MFNRIKGLFSQGSAASENFSAAASNHSRRYRPFRKGSSPSATSPPIFVTPPAATAAAGTAPGDKSSYWKYLRTGAVVLIGGYYVIAAVTNPNNPNSLTNQLLYPRGPTKWTLKVERLDDKITGYQNAYLRTAKGFGSALRNQTRNFALHRLGLQLEDITHEQFDALQQIGQLFSSEIKRVDRQLADLQKKQLELVTKSFLALKPNDLDSPNIKIVVKEEGKEKEKAKEEDAKEKEARNKEQAREALKKQSEEYLAHEQANQKKILDLLQKKMQLETNCLKAIEVILSKEQRSRLALSKDTSMLTKVKSVFLGVEDGKYEHLIEKVAQMSLLPSFEKSKVFVLNFRGDMLASQVVRLREEITAILNICEVDRGDRVIIQLNSGGGTVTGYGLCAAQLLRLKNAGLHITVSIDEVAASGGYLMASVADRIVASPFAVLGSVGVIATIPNFSERLNREGVVVEDVTAGKYKRTMTPYKKTTEEDRAKMKSDIEAVLVIFKAFLKRNRPSLNVDAIATGEIWHGPDALARGLIDELATTDDLLLQYRASGYEVYGLAVQPIRRPFDPEGEGGGAFGEASSADSGLSSMISSWLSSLLVNAFRQFFTQEREKFLPSTAGYGWKDLKSGEYVLPSSSSFEDNAEDDIPVNQQIMAIDSSYHPSSFSSSSAATSSSSFPRF